MNIFTASNVTITQNKKTYEKIVLTDEDVIKILNACHIGRHNHLNWVKPNVRLSKSAAFVRDCARRGDALVIMTENKGVKQAEIFVRA